MKKKTRTVLLRSLIPYIAVSLLISAASFASFLAVNSEHCRDHAVSYVKQEASRITSRVNEKISSSINYIYSISTLFDDKTDSRGELLKQLTRLEETSPFDMMGFVYPNGTCCLSNGEERSVTSISGHYTAINGLSGITGRLESPFSGRDVFVCYAPVRYDVSTDYALLIGIYYAETLDATLKFSFGEHEIFSSVITGSGEILSRSSDLFSENIISALHEMKYAPEQTVEKMSADMKAGKSGSISVRSSPGEYVMIYQPLSYNGWYLVNAVSPQMMSESVSEAETAPLLFICGIFVGLAVLAAGIALTLMRLRNERYVEHEFLLSAANCSSSLMFTVQDDPCSMKWYGDCGHIFEADGKILTSMAAGNDAEQILRQSRQTLSTGESSSELRLYDGAGVLRWVNCRMARVRDRRGRVVGVAGAINEAGEHSVPGSISSLYSEALRTIADSYFKIAALDLEKGMCCCLKADHAELEHFTGGDVHGQWLPYEAWLHDTVSIVTHPDHREAYLKMFSLDNIRRTFSSGEAVMSMTFLRRRGLDGEYRWAEVKYVPCRCCTDKIMLYIRETDENAVQK